LVAIAKASDCQREGQRHAHSTALTTPVASAVHIIATATLPCGPSGLRSNANRHSANDIAMNAIISRTAPAIRRAAR
jgi:hypothetical protein